MTFTPAYSAVRDAVKAAVLADPNNTNLPVYASRAAAVAALAVGVYFRSAEGADEERLYLRTAGSPGYEDQGDAYAQVSKAQNAAALALKASVADLSVSPFTFGAVGNGTADDTAPLAAAIASLSPGATFELSRGTFKTSQPLVITNGYLRVTGSAKIVAADDFVGDWLVEVTNTGAAPIKSDYFRHPIGFDQLTLDCRGLTRGLKAFGMDHFDWSLRIENAYGTSLFMDWVREGTLWAPMIINGLHRERFASPGDWSSATSYNPGQYVRHVDADWDSGTAYAAGDIVRLTGARYFALAASTNVSPSGNPLTWKQIPHEDYLCLAANTNKSPQTFNTNSGTPANRFWQKAYQDEAAIEIHDVTTNGSDRSNQINLFGPVVRDCGNKCYVRVDTSKFKIADTGVTAGRPVTHFNIWGGHIHGQPIAQVGGNIPIPDLQRMVELVYVINTNISGTNIRCGDGDDCIALMLGDGSSTKRSQDVRLSGVSLSGDGANDVGLLVMPSAQTSFGSFADITLAITDATSTAIVDPRRVFRKFHRFEQRCLLPSNLVNVPGGWTVEAPAGYALVRPYSYQITGEAQPRVDMNVSATSAEWRVGDGSAAPTARIRFSFSGAATQIPSGIGLELLGGAYDTGTLKIGATHLWRGSSGGLRMKTSAPSSATDGNPVMVKVAYPTTLTGGSATAGLPGYWAVSGGGTLWAIYTGDGVTHSWVGGRVTPLKTSVAADLPSIAAGASHSFTVALTGVVSGDRVAAALSPGGTGGLMLFAQGTDTDEVTVIAFNPTGSAVDLSSRTLNLSVIPA